MNPSSDDNQSVVVTTTTTAKAPPLTVDYTRYLRSELENQQLRRELQDAYRRIQVLESKLAAETCSTSSASVTTFCSATSSVTTAITGSAKANRSRRHYRKRFVELQRNMNNNMNNNNSPDHLPNPEPLGGIVPLSYRTASDLTMASHGSSMAIPALLRSFSTSSNHSRWSSSVDTETDCHQSQIDQIARSYLERIGSTESEEDAFEVWSREM
jgi:hypothetical protein